MRGVVQRVKQCSVLVNGSAVGTIGNGLLLLLGISGRDTMKDTEYIADKVLNMRIFSDDNDKMNLSLLDLGYEVLVVSQFTLYGDVRKGRRPSFTESARPDGARVLYEQFVEHIKKSYDESKIKTGIFQADMKVELVNDGPVTILLDSERGF